MAHMEKITLDASAQAHVRAYLEYRAVVGDADGGELLSEAEYAEYRRRAVESRRNRLYVAFRCVSSGVDCKNVGPQSKCFCGHRYRDHATDSTADKRVHCRAKGCRCALFEYVPSHGTFVTKCTCKHEPEDHDPTGVHRCRKCQCTRFYSSWSCSCERPWSDHFTCFETREERLRDGRPVDNLAGGGEGFEALGGITNFSSLVDGVDRLAIAAPGGAADSAAPLPGRRGAPRPLPAPASAAASSSDAIVEEEGVFFPANGRKMTQEEEFAIYEQKFKKSGGSRPSIVRRKPAAAAAAAAPPAVAAAGAASAAAAAPARRAAASSSSSSSSSFGAAAAAGMSSADVRAPASALSFEVHEEESALHTEILAAFEQEQRLEQQLAAPGQSQAKLFALKKQLQLARANRIRAERKAAALQPAPPP